MENERIFARVVAEELRPDELDQVSGGRIKVRTWCEGGTRLYVDDLD